MDKTLLQEQMAYYAAVVDKYDENALHITFDPQFSAAHEEWLQAVNTLHQLGTEMRVLELACGTGIWTKELLSICSSITALDGSPEMITRNRTKLNDPRIEYQCVDLFTWEPDQEYDLVFFSFWLSHVPPALLTEFIAKVRRAVRPGGHVFLIDEPESVQPISGPNEGGMYQSRTLDDGRTFRIVKVYYPPATVQEELQQNGFEQIQCSTGDYFFHLTGSRVAS